MKSLSVVVDRQVKILIVGSTLGIVILSYILYAPSLKATCQNWSSALYNKYYTLNTQFESLYMIDPEDAANEWMTYQRELYGYDLLCYMFFQSSNR